MSAATIAVKRLPHGDSLPLPQPNSTLAAGADLAAAIPPGETLTLAPGDRALVPTGFALAIPAGYEGQVRPRSGLAASHGVTVLNAPGTVDADYRGEVKVILVNHGTEPFALARGMRIAQLVIAPVTVAAFAEVAELGDTERGAAGFGSTGVAG
jgi:dUTP pyrophosphatase